MIQICTTPRWRRRLFGAAAAVLGGMLLGALTPAPASAHNTLRSTSPAADARVRETPAEIVLTFDEPAMSMGTRFIVTGPSGPVQSGAPQLVDNTVTQALAPGAPAGRYVVDWRVTSIDGHPVTGTFTFTSSAPGPSGSVEGETAPPAGPSTTPGPAVWIAVVAVAVLVLLVGGIVAVAAAGRRSRSGRQARAPDDTIAAPLEPSPDRTEDDSR